MLLPSFVSVAYLRPYRLGSFRPAVKAVNLPTREEQFMLTPKGRKRSRIGQALGLKYSLFFVSLCNFDHFLGYEFAMLSHEFTISRC